MSRSKTKVYYQCDACGAESPQYLGRCPECQAWNTLSEQKTASAKAAEDLQHKAQRPTFAGDLAMPRMLDSVCLTDEYTRYPSGFPELDRVLGGGLIPGGYLLIGGDPGIGKSTLMLQVAQNVAHQEKTVLYIAGEESPQQIKLRATRLGLSGERILIYPETNILKVIEEIQTSRPDLVVVDSIQSVFDPELTGTPGNVSQVKECAARLMGVAKALNVTILLVGHVTKEGSVSGPKLLEHTVDGVLYFEGEKFQNLRILRSVKNRFGSTHEIGVFEIGERGLAEVSNPSELFLSENSYQHQPGSAIVCTMEGNRPLLVEIQALVGMSTYAAPRRVGNGIDLSRLHQIVAVLERRLGMDFSKQDIYVNVVGGLRIQEPAADLGIALAVITSCFDAFVKPRTVFAGEIGLTGEIRPVSHHEARIAEAEKLGFETIVLPKTRESQDTLALHGLQQIRARTLMEALSQSLDQKSPMPQDRSQPLPPETQGDLTACPSRTPF